MQLFTAGARLGQALRVYFSNLLGESPREEVVWQRVDAVLNQVVNYTHDGHGGWNFYTTQWVLIGHVTAEGLVEDLNPNI